MNTAVTMKKEQSFYEPASGSVSKGSTITYVLSRGPKPSDNTNTGGNTDNATAAVEVEVTAVSNRI